MNLESNEHKILNQFSLIKNFHFIFLELLKKHFTHLQL